MDFKEKYNRENFLHFLEDFLPIDLIVKEEEIVIDNTRYKEIKKASILGFSESLDLHILEMDHSREKDPRIAIATDAFKILADHWIHEALVIFKNNDTDNYRFSYLTISLDLNEKNKPIKKYSNARRYSFYLGPEAKTNTPTKFLITRGRIINHEDLKSRFSIEVVNKEFYKEISLAFTKLIGGLLKLPSNKDKSKASLEFAVRLIGRIIFCWFLREKKSDVGLSLIPKDLLSLDAVKTTKDYYHKILEPVFFEILNKPIKSRREDYYKEPFLSVPYLNGGLFSPQEDDFYKRRIEDLQSQYYNDLIVPDIWLQGFLEILETYNFTINENTSYDEELSIDPEMLGRIFENLLAEINPETGETARKSTGSYYTPRVIVDYMIDESLLFYLKEKTKIKEDKLRALISYDLYDDILHELSSSEKEIITKSLSDLRILDPACGSGAFPIGALQKIVFVLQQIDPHGQLWLKNQIQNTTIELRKLIEKEFKEKNLEYFRKLGIIRENIYGIDIQPIATEISRLRCFLTLIVDENIDDKLDNRGIEPLPNLDFKFVTANSLIGLPKSNNDQQELFDDNNKIEQLKSLRDQYFTARSEERKDLMIQFSDLQSEMINELIDKYSFTDVNKADLTRKLTEWKPFKHKNSNWFDPEWMYGIKDGFTIVIGNPPYIGLNKMDKSFRKLLKENYREIHTGYNDLLYYFIYWGINSLSNNGIFCMIVANYFIGNTYAKSLRNYLNNKLLKIINFQAHHVFEQANVHTSIVFATNNTSQKYVNFINVENEGKLDKIHQSNSSTISIDRSKMKDNWIVADSYSEAIINKLFIEFDLLSDITNIEKGSSSGKNDVFTISKDIIDKYKIESNILRKNVKNSNIKKYFIPKTDRYLIYIDGNIDINDFPNTFTYLSTHKKELETRNEVKLGMYPWYRLERPRDIKIFEAQEKILVPYRAKTNTFAYDNEQYFNDGGDIRAIVLKEQYVLKYSIKYILALLNSKLFDWYYGFVGKPKGNVREYFNTPLGKLPIKRITNEEQKYFVEKIDEILKLTTNQTLPKQDVISSIKEIEQRINKKVFELYSLSAEEIRIIENQNI